MSTIQTHASVYIITEWLSVEDRTYLFVLGASITAGGWNTTVRDSIQVTGAGQKFIDGGQVESIDHSTILKWDGDPLIFQNNDEVNRSVNHVRVQVKKPDSSEFRKLGICWFPEPIELVPGQKIEVDDLKLIYRAEVQSPQYEP